MEAYGGGSIPVELAFLASTVSSESPTLCDPISARALALRLLSSEPHRIRRWRSEPFPSERLHLTLARWGRVSLLTLKAYRSPEIPLPRVNGSPLIADFGSQGTAGSPILLPPPRQRASKSSYKQSQHAAILTPFGVTKLYREVSEGRDVSDYGDPGPYSPKS